MPFFTIISVYLFRHRAFFVSGDYIKTIKTISALHAQFCRFLGDVLVQIVLSEDPDEVFLCPALVMHRLPLSASVQQVRGLFAFVRCKFSVEVAPVMAEINIQAVLL